MDRFKPLRILREDSLPGNLRLEKWYYFWINSQYTDPMVLVKVNDHCWSVHPGQNRWIVASLRHPRDCDVVLVSSKPLNSYPEDIHSVKLHNLSGLKPCPPQPKSEDWLQIPAKTTWDQWYTGWNDLAQKIRRGQQGSLALMDGSKTYIMGEGRILGCWSIRPGDHGLQELVSMFTFADSLGWNQL